jgi:hypothetical protein
LRSAYELREAHGLGLVELVAARRVRLAQLVLGDLHGLEAAIELLVHQPPDHELLELREHGRVFGHAARPRLLREELEPHLLPRELDPLVGIRHALRDHGPLFTRALGQLVDGQLDDADRRHGRAGGRDLGRRERRALRRGRGGLRPFTPDDAEQRKRESRRYRAT